MTITSDSTVYYDPYDVAINADPYPTYQRLRDEAPIYFNDRYDVWALSRHADVEKALVTWQTFSNCRSDILEILQSGVDLPSGVVLFEDPPLHTMHRGLMSRVFTPRRMAALEDQVRDLCARCLDPLVGTDRFDIIAELAAVMPMRVIGMLLGIPEADQFAVRDRSDAFLRTEAGKPMAVKEDAIANGDLFAEYIEWRATHPSDDLMTALLNAEFEDETGTTRTLTRPEVLTYTQVLAGAGNETTGRLVGWLAKVLAEHPDQRRELVEDRSLVPNAVEETLRFEPTGPHIARYVMHDVEYYGTTVPEGSALLLLIGAANRDERRYEHPDVFGIHRDNGQHLTFGYGLHYCLGANLARLEGRVALDELLTRFPEWDVDYDNARLAPTSTVRGWESMPIVVG
ncbi:MAG TPA: cytochrome P450 [Acidimicrobiales bacterium]|nr:cytochrome P450 [Acidimicrobiales bacterium]